MELDEKSLQVLGTMAKDDPEVFLHVVAELTRGGSDADGDSPSLETLALQLTGVGVDITAVFDDNPETTHHAFGERPDVSLDRRS